MRHSPLASENLTNKSAITWKRCKIGSKLVLITNRKSYMSFRLVPKSVTFYDSEWRNSRYVALRYFTEFGKLAFQHITASARIELIDIVYDVVIKKVHYLVFWWACLSSGLSCVWRTRRSGLTESMANATKRWTKTEIVVQFVLSIWHICDLCGLLSRKKFQLPKIRWERCGRALSGRFSAESKNLSDSVNGGGWEMEAYRFIAWCRG